YQHPTTSVIYTLSLHDALPIWDDRGADTMLTVGTTPLIRAAKAGVIPAMKLLIAHGANVNLPTANGITPLMAAAGNASAPLDTRDRKSTRLNSSHVKISYAVFC